MTPISALTNDELDRLIAERRGWVHNHCLVCGGWHWWLGEDTFVNRLPFTTDPRYAFELLEEMLKNGFNISFYKVFPVMGGMMTEISINRGEKLLRADTLERVISVAWLQWKGGE